MDDHKDECARVLTRRIAGGEHEQETAKKPLLSSIIRVITLPRFRALSHASCFA